MYGVQINDQYALFLSQHTSIFLGGIAAVSLMLRDVESGNTAKQLFKALLVTNVLGVAITTYAGITGVFVGFGWSDPAFFLLLRCAHFSSIEEAIIEAILIRSLLKSPAIIAGLCVSIYGFPQVCLSHLGVATLLTLIGVVVITVAV